MEELLGARLGVFVGMAVLLFGGASVMTGQALASTWRPLWHMIAYGLLLAIGDRLLVFMLFEAPLLSPSGYAVAAVVLTGLGVTAHRVTFARKMVGQYPWLYERQGLFGWRAKH